MTYELASKLLDRQTRFILDTPYAGWLIAAILIGTAVLVTGLYVRDLYTKRAAGKWPLLLLRLMLVACMAYILLEPTIEDTKIYGEELTVVVLVDASKSMERTDVLRQPALRVAVARYAGLLSADQLAQLKQGTAPEAILTSEQEQAVDRLTRIVPVKNLLGGKGGLLKTLGAQYDIELLAFSGAASAIKIPDGKTLPDVAVIDPDDTGGRTDLAHALDLALKFAGKKRVAAIIVVSDGDSNTGRNPLDEARLISAENIPVYTVGVGNPDEPLDVELFNVKAKKSVYVGDTVIVTADVKSSGYDEQEVTVALRSTGETLASQKVNLSSRATQSIKLQFEAKKIGLLPCVLETEPLPDEIRADNNEKRFEVEVIKEKRKVLLVEQYPRWEWRFLKNAIGRDPDFDLTMLLFHSDSDERPAKGEQYIAAFPKSKQDLYDYEIIIFGDVAREEFGENQLELIRQFVEEAGRPFVMIAGQQFSPYDYVGTPIEKLLPVVLSTDPEARQGYFDDTGFNIEMTAAGWQHPIFTLENDREANDRVWAEMPPSYWFAACERAKAGATVLAVHPVLSNHYGKLPLVVTQHYGAGKVLLLNIDSTWRWRYDYGDVYHYRFWGNILRWLIATPLEGESKYVRLSTDKEKYRQGELVTVTARVVDKDYYPFSSGPVFVEVTDPFASPERLQLELQDTKNGLYEGRFTASAGGSWLLQSVVPDLGEEGTQAALKIEVEAEELEARSLQMRADLLGDIAQITGGRFHMLDTAAAIPEELKQLDATSSHTDRWGLWDTFLVIVCFAAFITGEWILRKRKGYV